MHFATFQMRLAEDAYRPGVLIVRQTLAVGFAIQQLLEIATASGHTEWRGGCVFLPL